MYIYNYDSLTFEYTGKTEAVENPLETQRQGHFVPLIPLNATQDAPPEFANGQIPVFENGIWVVKSDYRGKKQVEKVTKEISEVKNIGEPMEGFQIVSDETALDIEQNPEKYAVVNNELVDISSTEEYKQQQIEQKIINWNKQFVQTTFGWLRINTAVGDILSLLNSLEIIARINGFIPAESLLFYSTPDFTQDFDEKYLKTLQFWNEQISYVDFQQLFNEVAQSYLERFKGE